MRINKTIWAIFLSAFLVRLTGILLFGIEVNGDTPEFNLIAYNLAHGHGYSLSAVAPFIPTTHREPLYPLFLALFYFIFGHNYFIVVVVQCLMGAFVCVLIYKIALILFSDREVARLAAFINVFYLPVAIFSLRLMSEIAAILFVAVIAYSLLRLLKKPESWGNCIVLGMAMGLLILTKLIFQLLPFFIFFLLLFFVRDRKVLSKYCVSFLLAAVLIAPWVYYNKKVNGTYAFGNSVRMSATLYMRVANSGLESPRDTPVGTYWELLDLEKQGIPVSSINERYLHKAMRIIWDHPFRYAWGTLLEINNMWRFGVTQTEIDPTGNVRIEGTQGKISLGIKYVFLLLNFVILFSGVLGFFCHRSKYTYFVMSLISYSNIIYALFSWTVPRYNVTVLPLMILFSSYFFVKLYKGPRYQLPF